MEITHLAAVSIHDTPRTLSTGVMCEKPHNVFVLLLPLEYLDIWAVLGWPFFFLRLP